MKILFFLGCCFTTIFTSAQVQVKNLRCEMKANPLGIDVLQPRFSWQLESDQRHIVQTTYQVIVSSSVVKLKNNEGDYWNSGEVKDNHSLLVPYEGKPLQSGRSYFWKVLVHTNKGMATIKETAFYTTGLFTAADWKAKWIGYDKASPWDSITQWSRLSARYFRKEFTEKNQIKRATVYISGLGLYELYFNGKKIGDQVLAPNPTDYRKSVFYQTHDVTKFLQKGNNAIGAVLGNGRFFTMRQNYKTQKHNTFGYPKLLLQLELEYENGVKKTVVSDESWKLNVDGPIRTNNEYDGEEYDARKEFKNWAAPGYIDSKWMQSELVEAPKGKLIAQPAASMKLMQTIPPIGIKKLDKDRYILDMGQNFAGWLKIKNLNGKPGQQVMLRFAESLKTNGELFMANLRDAKVTDKYIFGNNPLTETGWQPSFVYHGFRYVEISGLSSWPKLSCFEGKLIYDDIATTGSFQSSDATLNAIYKNAWWGIASNYKGMPVDCPQRNERQPWLGDRVVGAQGETFLFNNGGFYAKWMDDIEQAQKEDGAIPDVAPAFWNYYSDNITWPAAFITISNTLYNQFGDKQTMVKHYPAMKKWILYMKGKYLKDGILTKDKYGDWCVPPESLQLIHAKDTNRITDGTLIATAYYYKLLTLMQKFAKLTDNVADISLFTTLAEDIRVAFQQKFYNPVKKYYGNNTATANILPLYFGICADSLKAVVFEKIRQKIVVENNSHISTGLIGTQYLMRTLTEYGYADLAYQLASTKTYPGWGYMVANGATTIWELWNGNTADPNMNSQNHVMLLGDLLTWYYENLAGIKTNKTEVGFKKINMQPVLPAGLSFVEAGFQSPYGQIKSKWKNKLASFEWEITIPANTTAEIAIPANNIAEILESGKPVANNPDLQLVKIENGSAVFTIHSGHYFFVRNKKWKKGIVKEEFIFTETSFPESHAATIAETPAGLIAAWFGGTKEGNKDVCIWTSRLQNGNWTVPLKVADGIINDTLRHPCYNPVLYYAKNGELLLFYKIGPNVAGWKGYMKRSKDNGLSWGERESLPEGFLGPIKNKPILLHNELFCGSSTEKNGWKVHFEMTSDNGRTWSKTKGINDGILHSAIQPSILYYPDGRLQVLCRSKNTTINESWSSDNGLTWSAMKATSLPNNNSGADAVTLKDGRQLLVYNHVKPAPELPNGKGARTPLNVAISKDGVQWFAAAVLEDAVIGQYSYPSVIQTKDGLVHIVYTWKRQRIKHIVIDPAQLSVAPIQQEQWPGQTMTSLKPSDD